MLQDKRTLTLFILPGYLLYAVFVLLPIACVVAFSFTNMNGIIPGFSFVGWNNWQKLLTDTRLMASLGRTVRFTLICMAANNLLALALAFVMQIARRKITSSTMRVLFFLPTIMTPVVMGFVWYYIYKLGAPSLLALMGIPDAANLELIGTKTSMMCVIITTVWLQMGTSMLIYSAAINGIPGDIYESAAIDGASRTQSFFRVTLPLITPAFLINMVNTLITGFKQFDQIQAMTKGGPAKTTETLTILIHYHALMRNDYGYASAISALLLIIVLTLLIVLVKCFSGREYT